MRAVLRSLAPKSISSRLRAKWAGILDAQHKYKLFGDNASLIPPPELMHDGPVGYEEFKANGEEFLRHYIELGKLRPDERMLDVGSGIGRKTILLTRYLNQYGSYEGIDIVKSGIDWCREKITQKYPNFRFQLLDVYNKHYNPGGTTKASEYRFPFEDEYFDFVVLCSVFTHMKPEDVENYLSEVSRVLKYGGRCLITFFLLNPESSELIEEGQSTLSFMPEAGSYYLIDRAMPERAIGYDEKSVGELYERHGLKIAPPIHYGSWCGRKDFLSYQDIIIAYK